MAKVQSKSAQPALRRQSILSFELRGGGGRNADRTATRRLHKEKSTSLITRLKELYFPKHRLVLSTAASPPK
jgi:hypothetical protein